jgi:hypothetical protein
MAAESILSRNAWRGTVASRLRYGAVGGSRDGRSLEAAGMVGR